jgi:hypothetical protein
MLQPLWSWWSSETWMTFAAASPAVAQRAGEIDPVEAEDDVGSSSSLRRSPGRCRARRAGVQRMVGRESRADLEVGHDARAERLGERDARVPGFDRGRRGRHQDHGTCFAHCLSIAAASLDAVSGRRGRDLRHVARRRRSAAAARRFSLPAFGVEIDVDRAAWRAYWRSRCRAASPRGRRPARPAGRPIWCSCGRARPGRRRCGSSRSTAGAWRHRPGPVAPSTMTGMRSHQALNIAMVACISPTLLCTAARHRLAGDLGIAVRDGDRMLSSCRQSSICGAELPRG